MDSVRVSSPVPLTLSPLLLMEIVFRSCAGNTRNSSYDEGFGEVHSWVA